MNNKRMNKKTIALLITMLFSSYASAQAMNNDETATAITENTTVETIDNSNFKEIGMRQDSIENLKGFAKNIPLLVVLKQITPKEWIVKKEKNKTLNSQKLVSWTGGKTWVDTLKDISDNSNINVTINWDKKEILLSDSLVKITKKVEVKKDDVVIEEKPPVKSYMKESKQGVFELYSEADDAKKVETPKVIMNKVETTKAVVAKVEAPKVKTWKYTEDNLKDLLNAWGKQSGYKVVYMGDNYPIDKDESRVLVGEFDAEEGPVKQLSIDYGAQSRVKQPLSFVFYENKTLLIENLKYEQSEYPQYIQK